MGIDKIKKKKKKKPNQLVSKRKDGKRPGYYGSDDYGYGEAGTDSTAAGSSDSGGEDNYTPADYGFVVSQAPTPEPEPDTSGDDFEEDVFNVMEELGIKDTFNSPTVDVDTITGEDGYGEGDYDDGRSLYTSPTQTIKEEEPYYGYTPGPNTVTAQELYNLNRGLGDSDQQAATLANIQAINPIEKQGFFDSGIGKALKYAGLTLTGAGAFGPTLAKGANLYSQFDKTKSALNYMNQLTKGRTPTYAELINTPKGTGPKGPPTGFDDNDSGSDNIIPKNVIAKNVQRYSPAQINTLQKNRDLLQTYAEAGRLNEKGTQTLQQMNNIIEQYLV